MLVNSKTSASSAMASSSTASSYRVSSEQEELILVNEADEEIGFASKADCHDGEGVLHRAFSILLFNDQGELLLQQRSQDKRLWGGYWSNSCCSHPRRGETLSEATSRRLQEELGLRSDLEYLYKFSYSAPFENLGSERELCHVYAGPCDQTPQVNQNEVLAWRFISASALEKELIDHPDIFTPWFKQEWQVIKQAHKSWLHPATLRT